MTVLSARCSARARPIAARVHHRPPGARPGHDHDPDPAERKADELDWRAQPAAPHRTHPPAVAVDPGADQPTTAWLPQPDSSGRRQRRGSVTRGRCSPAVPDQRLPETGWPTIPWPSLEWHSSAVQPSTRLTYGVPSAATTTSRKSKSSPQRTVGCQRARRCQRCSRSQVTSRRSPDPSAADACFALAIRASPRRRWDTPSHSKGAPTSNREHRHRHPSRARTLG